MVEDVNQLAHRLVATSTAEKNPHAVELSKLGARKGGLVRAKKLSRKRRKQIARKAALTRWKSKQ
jgi:hypothetical protein